MTTTTTSTSSFHQPPDEASLNVPAKGSTLTPAMIERRMLVLAYIRRHILQRCNAPTLRVIVANTPVTSLCTARNDVRWLIAAGMLVQTNRQPLEFTLPELRKAALELAGVKE